MQGRAQDLSKMEAGDRDFALPFTHSEYLTRNKYELTVIKRGLYKIFYCAGWKCQIKSLTLRTFNRKAKGVFS